MSSPDNTELGVELVLLVIGMDVVEAEATIEQMSASSIVQEE